MAGGPDRPAEEGSDMPDSSTGGADDVLTAQWAPIPVPEAEAALHALYGFAARLSTLTSERDQTFLAQAPDGRRGIFKIANPAEREAVIAFQLGALRHLAAQAPGLPVPQVVPRLDGSDGAVPFADGTRRIASLLTYLDGRPLHAAPRSLAQAHAIGVALGGIGRGLADYAGAPPETRLLWDITHTLDLRRLVGHVDPERRLLVTRVLDAFEREILPVHGALPRQVIHNDFNPHNILVDAADPDRVTGIIDFGDMVQAPRVNDPAVALAYHIGRPDGLETLRALLRGYAGAIRLSDVEADILPGLIAARLAMTIVITEWRAGLKPESSAYILRNHAGALAGLHRLAAHPAGDIRDLILQARDGD